MNKPLEDMTMEELLSLWSAAYDFQGIAPEEEVREVLDACSEEFRKRIAAKRAHRHTATRLKIDGEAHTITSSKDNLEAAK